MTKERLEELIKQGALIYFVSSIDNEVYSMQLHSYFTVNSRCLVDEGGYWYKLDLLFESKEQAEWVLKTHAEHTERFEPPMWEDIYQKYVFRFIHKNTFCMLRVEIGRNIEILQDLKTIKIWDTTKEDYEKACEIVRDLFGGTK